MCSECTHSCVFHIQKLRGLRRDVRSLSKEFWNLTQVRGIIKSSCHSHHLGQGTIFYVSGGRWQLLSGETQLTEE